MTLIHLISQGGCYWKRERPDSPGHSIAVPNGTPFKVAIEGPQSNRFVDGTCRDGYFVTDDESKFQSANEVVNATRDPSSNAFLYIHFEIDGRWIKADDLRQTPTSRIDEAEEYALEHAIRDIRYHPKGKSLNQVEVTRAAARLIEKQQNRIDDARQWLDKLSKIDLAELGITIPVSARTSRRK
jgi:hypothetical protein